MARRAVLVLGSYTAQTVYIFGNLQNTTSHAGISVAILLRMVKTVSKATVQSLHLAFAFGTVYVDCSVVFSVCHGRHLDFNLTLFTVPRCLLYYNASELLFELFLFINS